MKKLIVVLSFVLAALLAVCAVLESQPDLQPSEPSGQQSHPSSASTIPSFVPAEPTPAPTQPTTLPQEPDDSDFVLITDYIPDVMVALAYAGAENFTGEIIYGFSDAYLRYHTVKKLAQAADILRAQGFGLVIWDAFRPPYAQEKLWNICPDPAYVSKPGTGSQSHCRGIAVDVTLYDLRTGQLLEMPSGFDEFSELGDRDYSDCSETARLHAQLLEDALESCGFKPYFGEWWHYSDTVSFDIDYEFDPATAGK